MKVKLPTLVASPARALVRARGMLPMSAGLAALLMMAAPAQALPVNGVCHVTTYYSDASMSTQVGRRSTCPGAHGMTGRVTKFFEVDDIPLGTGPRPKPPGQQPFPCDLQQNCVSSLPTPTVVQPWPAKKK